MHANRRVSGVVQLWALNQMGNETILQTAACEGIHVTAYQPLGGRPVAAANPNIDRAGRLLDLDRGTFVTPKTVQETRMVKNRDIFRLVDDDIYTHGCGGVARPTADVATAYTLQPPAEA
ncbi:predicted protein [Histoplasma mississippiense (nom. inval.)]|uniref:predicted protein n=1 Tax=Ajellomyces capsulatus (strain NAm1 / WU24) TaxID=2059318 RepID=UPI000157BC48|nr:predicted protein [Histoplasma mississippiense (nom. inval.)]EDN05870.1 predicted protein [Histoplasma mississippiense (nom. inval.)]